MSDSAPVRVLCVGAGHMGRSHALAYHRLDGFRIAGICTRSAASREALNDELGGGYPLYEDFAAALGEARPDAVCISTYPDTHADYALAALDAGCHVFIEKPIADSVDAAVRVVAEAREKKRKLVAGYILRYHPAWISFIGQARRLGKPLVMRMNLNQQSCGDKWITHKNLMSSVSPVVDCGVHYVDVMCQMTGAKPLRVSGLGARLSDELPQGRVNYGHLQVVFDDGSVGWYEAGWGPMMSETAFFVKDVVGPNGAVSIVAGSAAADGQSANVNAHTQVQRLRVHHADLDQSGQPARKDEFIPLDDQPDHDALCQREQEFFLRAIREDLDVDPQLEAALDSMRIVAAAEESFRTGETIHL